MSKITNDGLTRSDTGCFIAVPIWQQWASKGQVISGEWETLYGHTSECVESLFSLGQYSFGVVNGVVSPLS